MLVLSASVVSTVGLIVYLRFLLPKRLEQRYMDSMRAFSTAIELRYPMHRGKTEEVLVLTRLVAREMRLSARERHDLEMAVHLRDIGICAIPYDLINHKSWTDAERATYDRHAEVSGAMLELVPSLRHLANSVRFHHMRHDEFPRVMDGKVFQPPLGAEVLNVVTAYVWSRREDGEIAARKTIEEGVGSIYDPKVAEALLGVITSSRVEEPLRRAVV